MLDKVNIFITKFDLERLKNLLDKKLRLDDYDHALLTELKKAAAQLLGIKLAVPFRSQHRKVINRFQLKIFSINLNVLAI